MRAKLITLLAGLALAAPYLRAQPSLQFVLSPAAQSDAGSNEVFFAGTLINLSPFSDLCLNGIQVDFYGAATNYFGTDTNSFFANVPGLLLPGETYTDVVFGVTVNPGSPPGDYFASVTIQGGADIFATTNLASQTILITSADTVGDGIPDWWRQQYFGGSGTTTNAQSCATCDADTTGQNNLFKYVTGLDPTDPASVFVFGISNAPNASPQPSLSFGPAVAGRSYTLQYCTNLPAVNWLSAGGLSGLQFNLSLVTFTEVSPIEAQRFYRVQIALP